MVPMMTVPDIMARLRQEGIRISTQSVKAIVKSGVFGPGCCIIELDSDKAFVPRKAVENWIEKYKMEDAEFEKMREFYKEASA